MEAGHRLETMPTTRVALPLRDTAQLPLRLTRDRGPEDPVHLDAEVARPLVLEVARAAADRALIRPPAWSAGFESDLGLAPQHSGHHHGLPPPWDCRQGRPPTSLGCTAVGRGILEAWADKGQAKAGVSPTFDTVGEGQCMGPMHSLSPNSAAS